LLSFLCLCAEAQTDTSSSVTKDTVRLKLPRVIKKPPVKRVLADTVKRVIIDTNKLIDTLLLPDSILTATPDTTNAGITDTLKIRTKPQVLKKPIDSFYLKLLDNPYFRLSGKPLYLVISERQRQSKDEMFYLLAGLLLILAFIRLVFSRYFTNIFRLFFQPTFRQKQTREQLLQSGFPSFLLNLFFILSGAAYISLLISNHQLTYFNFWWLLMYSAIALLVLYTSKFVILTFAGWVFNVKEATDTYIFIVYLINKILGVVLIPFTLLIAFSKAPITDISITVSFLIIGLLFLYRYLVAFAPVHKEVKVSAWHFLFYICAFEIIPLLLIYKTLVLYLDKSL
jgi:hypothetical protein